MTTAESLASPALDFTAAARWPMRAAAHVLGAGLLLAVIAALPAAPSDLDRHQLPKETVVHLATLIAVLLARPWPPQGLRPAARWGAGLLLVVALVSACLASNGWMAFRGWSLLLTGAAALFTARHVAAHGAASTLLAWCCIAGIVGAGSGLAQAYGLDSPLFAATRLPGGTFGNRNFMAHFAALTLPVAALVMLTARRSFVAALAALGAVALVAAIVLTRSRAAWIGSLAGVLTFALATRPVRRRKALPPLQSRPRWMAVVLVAGVLAALLLPNRLAWRSNSPYSDTLAGLANHDEGSGRGRVLQYRNTIRLALAHPVLGVGPANWSVRYDEVAPPDDPSWVYGDVVPLNPWPSSDWMALLSETGFLGLFAALFAGVAIGWRGIRAIGSGGERALAGAALLALLAIVFVEGNFDAVLLLPAPLMLVAVATGALLERSDDVATVPSRARGGAWLLPLALAIVTLRSGLQTVAYAIAGNGRSITRLSWASRVDPGSYPIRIALAQRLPCAEARVHVIAVVRLAPGWPATSAVARRCGVRVPRRR